MGVGVPPGASAMELRPRLPDATPPNEPLSLPTLMPTWPAGPQASAVCPALLPGVGVGVGMNVLGMTTPLGSSMDDTANTPVSQQLPPPSSEGGIASVPMSSMSMAGL